MKNNKLLIILGMILLIGALAPMVSAETRLQIWRNASSGSNVSWVDNNGNWYAAGNLNVTGFYYGDGSQLTGISGTQINNNLNWINATAANGSYYLISNPYGFYNSTSLNLLSQLTNDLGIGNWTLDKTSYYNTTQVDSSISSANTSLKNYADNIFYLKSNPYGYINSTTASGVYVPYTGSNANVVLGDYNFSVGTSDLFVDAGNGRVGIGTTAPTELLHVAGSSFPFVVNTLGRIGIGTTAPGHLTHLEGGLTTTGLTLYVNRNLAAASTDSAVTYIRQQNAGDDQIALQIDQAGTGAGLVVSTGNVGIGTTAPTNMLNVRGTTGARFEGSATGQYLDILPGLTNGDVILSAYTLYGNAPNIIFKTQLGERMRIGENGNVGIGTTSPGYKLDVSGVINASQYLINGTAISASSLGAINGSGTSGYIARFNSTGSLNNSVIYQNGTNIAIGATKSDLTGYSAITTGVTTLTLGVSEADKFSQLELSGNRNVGGNQHGYIRFFNTLSGVTQVASIGSANSATNATDGDLRFSTADNGVLSEIIRITEDGKVGIGTTEPDVNTKLTVNGGALFIKDGNDAVIWGLRLRNAAETQIMNWQLDATGGANLWMLESGVGWHNTMTITKTGSVGIGTTGPGELLHVNSSGLNPHIMVQSTAANSYPGIDIKNDARDWRIQTDGTMASDALAFYDVTTGGTAGYRMVIDNSGNVGIGTSSPGYKLDVSGPVNASAYFINGTQLTASSFGAINGSGTSGYIARFNGTSSLNNSVIYQNGTNIGIGTTAPLGKLHINGGAITSDVTSDTSELNTWAGINANYQYATAYWGIREATTGHSFNIDVWNSNSEITALTILQSGYVGIGTTAPGYKLNVVGTGLVASTEYLLGGFAENASAKGAYLGYYVGSGATVQEARIRSGGSTPLALGTTAYPQAIYVLDTNGYVGIGTTAPGAKLEVAGVTGSDTSLIVRGNVNGDGQLLQLLSNAGTLRVAIDPNGRVALGNFVQSETKLELRPVGLSATGAMKGIVIVPEAGQTANLFEWGTGVINGGGNVGIGTTGPGVKLQVSGGDAGTDPTWITEDKVVIEGDGDTYLHLFSPNNKLNGILFTDPQARGAGNILYDHSTNSMRFAVNGGLEKVRIDNAGNVGIGTASPGYKLDVNGVVNASQYLINGTAISASSLGAVTGAGTSGNISRWNGTSSLNNSVIYESNNKIGIGTTAPDQKLSVNGNVLIQNSAATGLGFTFSSPASNWGPQASGLYFTPRDGVDATADFALNLWDGTSGTPGYGSIPTRLFVSGSTGNVGIGTTGPGQRLDVRGDVNTRISIHGSTSSGFYLMNPAADNGATFSEDSTGINIYSTNSVQAMKILNDGNVGIGTTAPGSALQVSGALGYDNTNVGVHAGVYASNYAGVELVSSSGFSGWIDFHDNNPTDYSERIRGGIGQLEFYTSGAGTQQMTINSVGNVGIGTTNPSKLLEVVNQTGVGAESTSTIAVSTGSTWGTNAVPKYLDYSFLAAGNEIAKIRAIDKTGETDGGSLTLWTSTAAGSTLERMRIDRGGYVGIGTTAPLGKLQVQTGTDRNLLVYEVSSVTQLEAISNSGGVNNALAFQASSYNFKIGNVGIGTAVPSASLHTTGDAIINGTIKVGPASMGTDSIAGLYFTVVSSTADYSIHRTTGAWTGPDYQQLLLDWDTGIILNPGSGDYGKSHVGIVGGLSIGDSYYTTEYDNGLIVQGNVGIGTTAPNAPLDVIRPTGNSGYAVRIKNEDATNGYGLAIESEGTAATRYALTVRNLAGSNTYFHVSTVTGSVGYVGIGTTAPDGILHVMTSSAGTVTAYAGSTLTLESAAANNFLSFLSPAGQNQGILFGDADANWRGQIEYNHVNDMMYLYTAAGSGTVVINSSGGVGIGTTAPSTRLDAKGTTTGSVIRATVTDGAGSSSFGYGFYIDNQAHELAQILASYETSAGGGTGSLNFNTRIAGTLASRMIIDAGGDVGISDSTPDGTLKLDVEGAVGATEYCDEAGNNCRDASSGVVTGTGTDNYIPRWNAAGTGIENSIMYDDGTNIGIGTVGPSHKLHVVGGANITGASTFGNTVGLFGASSQLYVGASSGAGDFGVVAWNVAGDGLDIAIEGHSGQLFIKDGGNVGIGTTAPTYALSIYRSGAPQFELINDERIFLLTNNAADDLLSFYYGGANRLQFNTVDQWFNSGNVGIGTTAPTERLDINPGSSVADSTVVRTVMSYADGYRSGFTASNTNTGGATFSMFTTNTNDGIYGAGKFVISNTTVDASVAVNTNFLINNAGNVGIGTINPTHKFDVASDVTDYTGQIVATSTSATSIGYAGIVALSKDSRGLYMTMGDNSATGWYGMHPGDGTIATTASAKLHLRAGAVDTGLTIDTTGKVGIGTTAPGTILEVAVGSSYLYVSGTGTNQGAPTGNYDHILTPRVRIGYMTGTNIGLMASNGADSGLSFVTHSTATGWVENVRIQPSGYVGIGTTSPQSKLSVAGVIDTTGFRIYTPTTDGDGQQHYGGLTFSEYADDSGNYAQIRAYSNLYSHWGTDIAFFDRTTELMRITHGGMVGIGTPAPDAVLDITSGANGRQMEIGGGSSINVWNSGKGLYAMGGAYFTSAGTWYAYDSAMSAVEMNGDGLGSFKIFSNSGLTPGNTFTPTPRVTVLNSGNVGIGTTSPLSKLDISGQNITITGASAGNTSFQIYDNEAGSAAGFRIKYNDATGATYLQNLYNHADGDIYIQTKVDGTPVNAMFIESAGNVGIGTTDPGTNKLLVNGKGVVGNILLEDYTTYAIAAVNEGQTGHLRLFDNNNFGYYTSSTGLFFVDGTSGNVGIGTTAPERKLEIGGTANSNSAGPHLWFRSDADSYPEMQMYNYAHDNILIAFDKYTHTDGVQKSSDSGSSFDIYKNNDLFRLRYGVATAGTTVTMTDGLVLTSTGSVGIGTTAPTSKLEIQGADGATGILLRSTSNGSFYLNTNSDSSFTLYDGGGTVEGTPIAGITQKNGNVGIGDSTPDYTLDVEGSLGVSGNITASNCIVFSTGGKICGI